MKHLKMAPTEGAASGGAAAPVAAQPVGQKEKVAIINGRMPVAVVAQVRFGNNKGESTKQLATMFGTTVGKIDDIKKNRNFAYVTDTFKPTQAMIDEGIAWLKRHPAYDAANVDKLVSELEATPVASAEDAAAFEAVRVKARGQTGVTKDGQPVTDAGGGNRRAKKGDAKAADPAAGAATGDALLA